MRKSFALRTVWYLCLETLSYLLEFGYVFWYRGLRPVASVAWWQPETFISSTSISNLPPLPRSNSELITFRKSKLLCFLHQCDTNDSLTTLAATCILFLCIPSS